MPSTTRGPLPPGVYWRRRLAVLSVALVLVVGIGRVLGDGSDGASDDAGDRAAQPGALTSPTTTVADPAATPTKKGKDGKGDKGTSTPTPSATPPPTPTPPPLPEPTGPCPDEDVFVTPSAAAPVAGSDITFMLNLQAGASEACTWQVSADTVTMRITSGQDDIWSSTECPDAIPTQDVVVRRASVTQVPVVWSSRRSDEYCSGRTAWALPGFYHVATAALAGEPTDVQFELVAPTAPTVTQTAQPEGGGKGKGKNNNGGGGR